jgi:hypothetical protein
MTSFTRTFGGQVIQPTYVSYATYTTAVSLALSWPFEVPADGDVVAYQNDVATTVASLTVTLPNATLVSVGQAVLVNNVGGQTFTVLSNDATNLGTVASGQQWYFYLTNNATPGGVWRAVQFGASTSTANAASLAGAGLIAVVTKLNQNLIVTAKTGNYSPVAGDLATVLRSTGGSVVYTPASAVTLTDGWFVYVINSGTGTLTWTPGGGQTIDGSATKVFQPTDSAVIFSDGTNFYSLGFGQSITSTVTGVSVDLTGSGTLTLNANQVAAQVQDFSGTLTGNRIVEYGTGVGYWFVRNNTSGAFSVTFRVNGSDPGVVVSQGSFSILRSNGSNMSLAFTATSGTVTSVATTANLTGGPITTTGTLDLSDTAVTPGSYGSVGPPILVPVVTVDQKGRITGMTTITAGTAASAATGTTSGTVPVIGGDNNLPSSMLGSTGDFKYSIATSLTGWCVSNGLTIGNAASAGTSRANADTVNLFTLLWNNLANAQAPVSGGRGGSAAADYAANKTIGLPDLRGITLAGLDNAGGAASAARLSVVMSSTTMGASGGQQQENTTVTSTGVNGINYGSLNFSQISGTINGSSVVSQSGAGVASAGFGDPVLVTGTTTVNGNFSITVSGTTALATNVQPTMVVNPYIKL